MKIYVSDKDQNKYVYYYGGGRESIECKSTTEPMVVSSLEQHEQEIRKPLEEEIERLKKQLDLNDKEHFKNALKQLRETDYDTIRKIERQKVIAELEEWVDKNTFDFVIKNGYFTAIEPNDLKQKLNEMKEV